MPPGRCCQHYFLMWGGALSTEHNYLCVGPCIVDRGKAVIAIRMESEGIHALDSIVAQLNISGVDGHCFCNTGRGRSATAELRTGVQFCGELMTVQDSWRQISRVAAIYAHGHLDGDAGNGGACGRVADVLPYETPHERGVGVACG